MENIQKEDPKLVRLRKHLITRFHKACADYNLIEDNDHILIGLSGGKDSLALVELLGQRQKIYVPKFRVSAAHVIVENIGYKSDTEYLNEFCREQGVDFHLIRTSYNEYEPIITDKQLSSTNDHKRKNHCFLCSWYRRKALFDLAKEIGCNKLALGHHKDDIVETLLMNLMFQGAFATIPPQLKMDKFPMTLIRPLCLIKEENLKLYSEMREYKQMPKLCPFEKESSRAEVKRLVKDLERFNPNVLDSIWSAMENIKTDYLPKK